MTTPLSPSSADDRFAYQRQEVAIDDRVEDLLARMTDADKAGLMFQGQAFFGDLEQGGDYGRPAIASLIRDKQVTAFCIATSSDARELAEWHNAAQRIALEHPLGIPVTVSSDPRHGTAENVLSSTAAGEFSRWPEPIGIAAIGTEDVARAFGEVTRREYVATGIRVALHPQIDLSTEPRWARIMQTFGEDADLTSRLVVAYLEGLQGDRVGPDSVAGMAKHFPGGGPQKDGLDPHFADGREQVYPGGRFEHHLAPFIAAIEAGVSQIMPYYGMPVGLEYDEVGFAFDKAIITTLLRERLGFDGIVCTDFGLVTGFGPEFPARAWGVEHLNESERVERLLDAGVDQLGGETCPELVLGLVAEGRVSRERLDVSARRLLREKFRLGLFDDRRFVDVERAAIEVGAASSTAVARQAQQDSLTLLTNDKGGVPVLPLVRGIAVYAEGVEAAAFEGFARVVERPEDADVAIIRTKSPNYSDPARFFLGSLHMGSLEYTDAEIARVTSISDAVPTVLDVFLERPAVLTPFVPAVGALIGSYGTEDRPFVEVLFGEAEPQGRLPFDLPRSMVAVAQSRTDVPYDTADPLFRFGHGLRYAAVDAHDDLAASGAERSAS